MLYFIFSVVLVLAYVGFNVLAEKPQSKKSWAWIVGVGLMMGGAFHIINYFSMPTLAYDCWPVYFEMMIFVVITIVFTSYRSSEGDTPLNLDNKIIIYTALSAIGGALLLLVAQIYTGDVFHPTYQRNLLEVRDTVEVQNDVAGVAAAFSPAEVTKMKLLTEEVAMRKVLNNMGDLKNTFDVSELTLQSATVHADIETVDGLKHRLDFDDKLIYVGILEYKNFWTWNSKKYSHTYVLVDATTAETYIISKVNGEELKIAYTPEANFNYNLERHLRNNGYADVILDDYNIEIDENGRPFAPVTTLEHVVGMSTPQVTGVAVVDVQTGDINWYKPEDAPSFVNRIYPEWLVYERITNWGEYPNGYFHWTNNEGLLQPCEGMDIVQTKNGCCYYVGIQAKTGTFDTEGYMLVDIRTGAATYYKRDGISEAEAVRVLRTNTYDNISIQVNDSILRLTEPVFYNIEGKNTFFATFVANADLTVKYYAFCSADSKDVVGVGKTLEEARTNYLNSYYKSFGSKDVKFAEKQTLTIVEVQVLEKSVVDNVFYFRLKGYEDKVFKTTLSDEMSDILWEPTNKVKVSFSKTDSKFVELKSYEIIH